MRSHCWGDVEPDLTTEPGGDDEEPDSDQAATAAESQPEDQPNVAPEPPVQPDTAPARTAGRDHSTQERCMALHLIYGSGPSLLWPLTP